MLYALYIAEDDTGRKDPDAWNYGVEHSEIAQTIERVLDSWGEEDGDELVIRISEEEE